jgi:hypothetical protein
MSGAKRNADTLNTVGIVVVGICGAVLVYVTITALQAFYVNDTSDVQTMADYGGNDTSAKNLKASQMGSINEYGTNALGKGSQTYRMPITEAKKMVIDPKADMGNLVPMVGSAMHPSVMPIFGRPVKIPDAAGSAAGSGSDAGSAAGSGSGSGVDTVAPVAPTGTTGGSGGSASTAKGNGQ